MQTYRNNKEKVVSKVFEDVFEKYDIMNDLMSLGIHRIWKKTFIEWLNPSKNAKLILGIAILFSMCLVNP